MKFRKLFVVFAMLVVALSASVFASPPAHAAQIRATMPDSCGNNCTGKYINGSGCTGIQLLTSANVYDSYNNLEGTIRLHKSTSCNTIWATFLSNNNTWQHVTVYTEYTDVYGYLQSPLYNYASNTNFDAPMYQGSDCYYGEVVLQDNRGTKNPAATQNVCI